ncbi:MAG: nitroreductase [Actinomycetia bacterium]|nr:nitroreductase [Actinomycetes bacterium]
MRASEPFAPEDVAALIRAAVAAPSIHNSQPWRFGDHDDRIELYLDRRRRLPVTDPGDRERVISCGAALFNLRLAMAHLGYEPVVTLLPGPDHLATVARGERQPANASLEQLFQAIHRRRSYRRPFGPQAVARDVIDELVDAAGVEEASLDGVTTPAGQLALIDLSSAAASWLLTNPAYRSELAHWTRYGSPAADGVQLSALGGSQYPVNGLPWALAADPDVAIAELRAHVLLVLGTSSDTPEAWLQAGQALQRVLLTATARGLVASLFTQVAEVDATRRMLAHHLRLTGLPQAVLRIGYPAGGDVPSSARRRLDAAFLPDSGGTR